MRFNPNLQRGLTLLELLVTMAILGLVTALLFQGLNSALVTYQRVQSRQWTEMPVYLSSKWLQSSLAGVQVDSNENRQFLGSSRSIEAVSHAPLVGDSGEAQPIEWRLSKDNNNKLVLYYSQVGLEWPVMRWPSGSEGKFSYYFKGEVSTRWPAIISASHNSYLKKPDAISLKVVNGGATLFENLVDMPNRTYPRGDYRDL
ncbi:PulJ/GspJ family protein [Aeromonas salmonicida]|uniref:PulJ/GspJ family protein n=1 Tax=Aeromonas salmonicida TaxID=645 RepID=UPI0009BFA09F|nr:prepilin-type N-terminal cleavage/methylation domain-containing protein [Aeromonas salmonicida]MDE7529573.1 prepilin-type N-terminal cleavage/methylation domain-containing protein [Aeromonas salmonicida]MDE7533839.1 prepilin-type N-terminal cleavage/methylation domain-containing protein [Aeromonas salmonicida]